MRERGEMEDLPIRMLIVEIPPLPPGDLQKPDEREKWEPALLIHQCKQKGIQQKFIQRKTLPKTYPGVPV